MAYRRWNDLGQLGLLTTSSGFIGQSSPGTSTAQALSECGDTADQRLAGMKIRRCMFQLALACLGILTVPRHVAATIRNTARTDFRGR